VLVCASFFSLSSTGAGSDMEDYVTAIATLQLKYDERKQLLDETKVCAPFPALR
jgi:hypothetical protein